MKIKYLVCIVALLLGFGLSSVHAGVSSEEAAALKTTLTPFGAERAGSADGVIPEWTGGITSPPENYKEGEFLADPYADDKILFTITAANYKEYSDKLSDGQKALFEKYPEVFKMNIYPTRRSASAPEWVYKNTFTNATKATVAKDGAGVDNAYGGIPFPIPKTGIEVVWNHLMRWAGESVELDSGVYNVYSNGKRSISSSYAYWQFPYYRQDGKFDGNLFQFIIKYLKPARRKGEILLVIDPINQVETPRQAWQYIPGQRRVRRAPTVAYDTPNGPMVTYDDAYVYNGSPDRYNWKLIGKKEVYIPYNSYKLLAANSDKNVSEDELFSVGQPNPKFFRWELHRVWVVEGTLKPGKRHIYAKRVFYIDEDSWNITLNDRYDARGSLWRIDYASIVQCYNFHAPFARWYVTTDLLADYYGAREVDFSPIKPVKRKPDSYFTPQNLRKLAKR